MLNKTYYSERPQFSKIVEDPISEWNISCRLGLYNDNSTFKCKGLYNDNSTFKEMMFSGAKHDHFRNKGHNLVFVASAEIWNIFDKI